MDGLIEVVTSTISQDSWDTVGGPASIASIGTSLLISADAETHDKISSLFDLFRKRWGSLRTVSVRAHWLWLSEAAVSDALAADQKAAGEKAPYGVISDETWKKLLTAAGEAKKRTPYHAMVTCHNGQTVFTHGAEVGVVRPQTRDLGAATDALLDSLQSSNPEMREIDPPRETRLSRRTAIEHHLVNRSATGAQERVGIITTLLADGNLFYYVTVVPSSEREAYDSAFRKIADSIRLTEQ